MKTIFFFILIAVLLCSCNKKTILQNESKNFTGNDTILFKKWLSDTLPFLQKESKVNLKIIIPKDSSYLELKKIYFVDVMPNHKYNNKDLETALFLLKENDSIPKEKFNLLLDVTYFYDVRFINLEYNYEYQIDNFVVKSPSRETKYTFLKGNLIDKKITDIRR